MKKANKLIQYFTAHPNASIGGAAKASGTTYGYAYKVKQKMVQASKRKQVEIVTASGQTLTSANDKQVGGNHYKGLNIQPWDAMQSWLTPEEFRGFLKGNAIKYLARRKNADDLQKAQHYLEKLNEVSKGAA